MTHHDDLEMTVALRVLEALVAQRARQPVISVDDMRSDATAAWQYASIFVAEAPVPEPRPAGF